MTDKENIIRYFNVLNLLNDSEWHWEFHYKLLKKYIAEYHDYPLYNEKYYGCWLRNWLDLQMKNLNNLSEGKRKLLSELTQSVSSTTPKKRHSSIKIQKFYNYLEMLSLFISQNKRLPSNKEIYMNFGLGDWIKRVHIQFKSGKISEELYNQFLSINKI